MADAVRHQGPTIEWDIDNNLPMYTKDFIQNLPHLVESLVIEEADGTLRHINPFGVKFVMRRYGKEKIDG